jgi:DNA-binding PadR family transcriptional regulator
VSLSPRDRLLLELVRDGEPPVTSRQVDLRYSARMDHTEENIFKALERLVAEGLVARHDRPGTPWSHYELTQAGHAALDE